VTEALRNSGQNSALESIHKHILMIFSPEKEHVLQLRNSGQAEISVFLMAVNHCAEIIHHLNTVKDDH
jgi:hypothetical protein